ITLNVLHQFYQGIFKHFVSLIKITFGEKKIDVSCHHLSPNYNEQHFLNGISFSHISRQEHL
ncbi:hypothetical protein BGY98DRAFT_923675, partial [Russula aff. rugulosa BPL654]